MQLTGSQIVIECLLEQGVDTIFGYPGGAILNIYDALYQYRDKINHVLTSHEQGAAHAADGYARSTGKVGVGFATSGPGATNLVTGIATAHMDSIPMVAITANVANSILGKDSFQEIDIAGVTIPQVYEYLATHKQKVLVLGYKDLGRGVNFKTTHNAEVEENRQWLKDNIKNLWTRNAVLSFDNLALEQLDIQSLLTPEEWERFYMGDDGSFTFYIDLVRRTFSKNSLCHTRFPMEDKTIDEMFQFIRDYYKKD